MSDIEILSNIQSCSYLNKVIEQLIGFKPQMIKPQTAVTRSTTKTSNLQSSPKTNGPVSNSEFNCMFTAIIAILKKVTSIDEKFSKIPNDLK